MTIEVVATDFDGTFVASDHTIRDDTVELYNNLRSKVKIIICTGRVYNKAKEALTKIRPGFDFDFFPGVYCHGAVIFDKDENDIIYKDSIDYSKVCQLIDEVYNVAERFIKLHETDHPKDGTACVINKFDHQSYIQDSKTLSITVYTPHSIIVDFENDEMKKFASAYSEMPDRVLDRRFNHDDLKDVLYFAVNAHPCVLNQLLNYLHDYIGAHFPGEMRCILPVPESCHILKTTVNKAKGLIKLCEAKGWEPSNILAIGNSENDVEMLKWAECSVAMGDGTEETKLAAKFITDYTIDGGWATAMKKHVLSIS